MSAALQLVKSLAANGIIIVSIHANDRFVENGFTTADVEAGAATVFVDEDYPV